MSAISIFPSLTDLGIEHWTETICQHDMLSGCLVSARLLAGVCKQWPEALIWCGHFDPSRREIADPGLSLGREPRREPWKSAMRSLLRSRTWSRRETLSLTRARVGMTR